MSNNQKKYLTIDQQIDRLKKDYKLVFKDKVSEEKFKEYLTDYGYFNLLKKNTHPLMFNIVDNKKVFKPEFCSNNIRYLFDIDRNISIIVYKYFKNVEYCLNSAITSALSKAITKCAGSTYLAALSEQDFNKIFNQSSQSISKNLRREKNVFSNILNFLYRNFKSDHTNLYLVASTNRDREDSETIKKIDKGWFRKEASKQTEMKFCKNWEYIDLFSLASTWGFSQLNQLFATLNSELQAEILKTFFSKVENKKRIKLTKNIFYLTMNILKVVRNILCHNGYLLSYKYEIEKGDKEETKHYKETSYEELTKFFNYKAKYKDVVLLYGVIKIIEGIIGVKKQKIFQEIKMSVNDKLSTCTYKDDVSPILFEIIEDISSIEVNTNESTSNK